MRELRAGNCIKDNALAMVAHEIRNPLAALAAGAAANDAAGLGLGLGLAIVRKIVELHGGQVRAESAGLHRGSTLALRLPLAA